MRSLIVNTRIRERNITKIEKVIVAKHSVYQCIYTLRPYNFRHDVLSEKASGTNSNQPVLRCVFLKRHHLQSMSSILKDKAYNETATQPFSLFLIFVFPMTVLL